MGDNGYQMRLKKILCIQAYEEALDRIMYITCDPDLGWTLSQAIFEILEATCNDSSILIPENPVFFFSS